MKKHGILSVTGLIILLIISCSFQNQVREKPVPEKMTGADFLSQGRKLLSESEDEFLEFYNLHSSGYPGEAPELLESLIEYEKRLLNRYAGSDLRKAEFIQNNIAALSPGRPPATVQPTYTMMLREQKEGYAGRARRMSFSVKLPQTDGKPLFTSAEGYLDLLVEIAATRTYKADNGLTRREDPASYGSGFFVTKKHIVTAYHVVENIFLSSTIESEIIVNHKGRVFKNVKLASWDSLADIAVLELPEEIPTVPDGIITAFGNSSALKPGTPIYCLGNQFGYNHSMTAGIVSSPSRRAPEIGDWIQIDADIAPGSSGGMLIGGDGYIYGLAIAGVSGTAINFAVPSNIILGVIDTMIRGESVRRPWAGLLLEEDIEEGNVRISDIFPSSPLRNLPVEAGDKITTVNGLPIRTVSEAQKILMDLESGNLMRITLESGGNPSEYIVKLGRRPDFAIYNTVRTMNKISSLYPHFGFKVDPASVSSTTFYTGLTKVTLNLYTVQEVRKSSFLYSMGVRAGDNIGFLKDIFYDKQRIIQVLHVPSGKKLAAITEISDYIYTIGKGKYDENIF